MFDYYRWLLLMIRVGLVQGDGAYQLDRRAPQALPRACALADETKLGVSRWQSAGVTPGEFLQHGTPLVQRSPLKNPFV